MNQADLNLLFIIRSTSSHLLVINQISIYRSIYYVRTYYSFYENLI